MNLPPITSDSKRKNDEFTSAELVNPTDTWFTLPKLTGIATMQIGSVAHLTLTHLIARGDICVRDEHTLVIDRNVAVQYLLLQHSQDRRANSFFLLRRVRSTENGQFEESPCIGRLGHLALYHCSLDGACNVVFDA